MQKHLGSVLCTGFFKFLSLYPVFFLVIITFPYSWRMKFSIHTVTGIALFVLTLVCIFEKMLFVVMPRCIILGVSFSVFLTMELTRDYRILNPCRPTFKYCLQKWLIFSSLSNTQICTSEVFSTLLLNLPSTLFSMIFKTHNSWEAFIFPFFSWAFLAFPVFHTLFVIKTLFNSLMYLLYAAGISR